MRTPARHRQERGAASASTVLSMVLLVVIAYLGFKFIPVYIAAYDFDNALKTQAQYSGAQKPDSAIMSELLAKAADLKLPVAKENIKIERSNSHMTITTEYVVPVKTLIFSYNWKFAEEETAVLF